MLATCEKLPSAALHYMPGSEAIAIRDQAMWIRETVIFGVLLHKRWACLLLVLLVRCGHQALCANLLVQLNLTLTWAECGEGVAEDHIRAQAHFHAGGILCCKDSNHLNCGGTGHSRNQAGACQSSIAQGCCVNFPWVSRFWTCFASNVVLSRGAIAWYWIGNQAKGNPCLVTHGRYVPSNLDGVTLRIIAAQDSSLLDGKHPSRGACQ
mmetsp:Transcript_27409/g.64011  ORF Transcript_27409/g.64011 Transcript_27409/m.64011 type:complete len:209 (-) Transcript_27409:3061-3687(-)